MANPVDTPLPPALEQLSPRISAGAGQGVFGVLSLLARKKRWILAATLAGGALAAGVAFLLPNTYTATALIMSPQKEQSSLAMLAGQLAPLAAAAGADLGLKNPGDLYIGLLGSRTIADHLIKRFDLKALYREKTDIQTREHLRDHCRFNTGRDSLIRIEVEDKDPKRAADMANAFVSELDDQNKRLASTEASQRRAFLEKQLTDERANLSIAEDLMKGTQQRTGVIDVPGQTELAIATLAQLRAQVTAHEVDLDRLRMGATAENPQVQATEAELTALRAQLRKMDKTSGDSNPLVPASAMPSAGLAYVRSLRDLKYHEYLYEFLAKQYEAARIDEQKSAPSLQVVDSAIPPDRKSGPHRSLLTLFGCFSGAVISACAVYLRVRSLSVNG